MTLSVESISKQVFLMDTRITEVDAVIFNIAVGKAKGDMRRIQINSSTSIVVWNSPKERRRHILMQAANGELSPKRNYRKGGKKLCGYGYSSITSIPFLFGISPITPFS